MNVYNVPYHQTGYFSKLILNYLKGDEALVPFYNKPVNIEFFAELITERALKPIDRQLLVQVLKNQYEGVNVSELIQTNITKLNNSNCYTVTTGHQLNLFTGPLYFIYKIISTINLAKSLSEKYPENHFVPIYWMASEDHDFEEVNHFNLFGNKIELPKTQEGAVGKMKLTGIEETLPQLKELLGNRIEAEQIIQQFATYYKNENTFAQATRGFVNAIFGKQGLVIIDGDDRALKQQMFEEFSKELINQENFKTINRTTKQIVELGYKPQITPREINLFYLQENSRERIVFENNKYHVLNTSLYFSEKEIIAELEVYPERFSPNVALRPLYQEKVLPNLAYIGGGGELGYWFQLKEMFNANHINFPILVLRNSVLIIDDGSKKRLDKIGVTVQQLFGDTDLLINQFLKENSEVILDLKKEESEITQVFTEMMNKADKIDATLKPMISAELQKTLKSIQNIEARLVKAEKQKEDVRVNQIRSIKEIFFPKGSLQERHDNLSLLFLLLGFNAIDEIVEQLNPLEQEFKIIEAGNI